jgi:hypothetical protein
MNLVNRFMARMLVWFCVLVCVVMVLHVAAWLLHCLLTMFGSGLLLPFLITWSAALTVLFWEENV